MNQWFDTTLVAISFVAEGFGSWKILELPARSMIIHPLRGKFLSLERAEQVVSEQWSDNSCIVVDPLDLTEEIVRRNAFLARQG